MVYYLKYRPQTIDALDSDEVKKTLHAVLSAAIPHSFLFTGPKGLGKTSTARIVAKYVNCELASDKVDAKSKSNKKTLNPKPYPLDPNQIPCNQCEQCISITDGTNMDVLEIDAASNRGIDEMRDLREKIRLLPVSAKKKVYIIDEVHMLTTEAFNALLKTLEEPPPHAMFILCTTEQQKVPATILSRCFHIRFKKATQKELVASFVRIMKAEKIPYEEKALEQIASFADGSFRDGVKVLEELTLGLAGKTLTCAYVDASYHLGSISCDITDLFHAFIARDTKKGLTIIQKITQTGIDIRYFTQQMLFTLHDLLLIKVGVLEGKPVLDIDIATLRDLVAILSKAHTEIKYAVIAQLPLELALVEWTQDEEEGERGKEKVIEQEKQSINVIPESRNKTDERLKSPKGTAHFMAKPAQHDKDKISDIPFLHKLLDIIKGEQHMLAGILRSCKISQTKNEITIEAPSDFHKQRLEDKKALDVIRKVCENITGKSMKVLVILKS